MESIALILKRKALTSTTVMLNLLALKSISFSSLFFPNILLTIELILAEKLLPLTTYLYVYILYIIPLLLSIFFEFTNILIATGGRPQIPSIPGHELGITSDGFFDLSEVPKKTAVVRICPSADHY